ncbi:MAG: hypothetical protein PHU14_05365 [Methylovulum sp.]|nr:hypothetical protein [Methylovulum sp.]
MTIVNAERSYASKKTQGVEKFFGSLRENLKKEKGVALDSATTHEFMASAISLSQSVTGFDVPEGLVTVREELKPEQFSAITSALLDGASVYEREHGCTVPADVLEVAIGQAYSTSRHAASRFALPTSIALDSSSNEASDPLALQTNRAVTSILSTIMSACPFALYLPFDLGSNEAKLAIVSHRAGLAHGQYALDASLDGANSGDVFLSSSRTHTGTRGTPSGLAVDYTGKLTKVQNDRAHCDAAAGDLKLMKNRALVYINGQVAAKEVTAGIINGSIVIGAITYSVAGVINNDTGVFTVTVTASDTAPLGAAVPLMVKGFIDYERDASITPSVSTSADTYLLYAKPWRAFVQTTPDADSQMANELGIDPASQSMVAIGNQLANERHYDALFMAAQLASQNADSFLFDWTDRNRQMNAAQIFNDMLPAVGRASQKMANDTMSYGIKYWYVGVRLAALIQGLPSTIFEPSGLAARPGVYRLGRLFGLYEVYYCPKADIISETSNSSKILFIGQALESARAPIVFGDAVAPIIKPLGINTDMKSGFFRYERNFTEVNPHTPSSLGCAQLDVTDLSV